MVSLLSFKKVFLQTTLYCGGLCMELIEGLIVVLGDGQYSYESEDVFVDFAANERLIHYACMAKRPGFEELSTKLEHTHYKPLTARNELMSMRAFLWNGVLWYVISIPSEERHLLENMAGSYGMRVANGVPMMLGHNCRMHFPIHGKNVFTLENVSGHPVYRNDDAINRAMQQAEHETAEKIRADKEQKPS